MNRVPFAMVTSLLGAAALVLGGASGAEEHSRAGGGDMAERLRRVLWERSAPDGKAWGGDALDPLLWEETRGLLEGPWHEEALAALEALLEAGPTAIPADPLRRALLQRDLRAVFGWLAERSKGPQDSERALALAAPLARAIERLALAPGEIDALPDTLRSALAEAAQGPGPSEGGPALPRDLLDPDGPWVRLGGATPEPLALAHSMFTGGRSAFEILVALPGGREETLGWIERVDRAAAVADERGRYRLPPDVELPAGSRVALLRRAVLLDDAGSPHVSGIVESLQLREFQEAGPAPDDPALEQVLFGQTALELRLDRAGLLAGRSGLRRLRADEEELSTFMTHGIDPFEFQGGAELERWPKRPLETCGSCHRGPGVGSLASVARFDSGLPEPWRPPRLIALGPEAAAYRALRHASDDHALGLLRGLLAGSR